MFSDKGEIMKIFIYADGWNIGIILNVVRIKLTRTGFHAYSENNYIGYFGPDSPYAKFILRGV